MTEKADETSNILPRREVVYCGACGMPLEYCEYGPDYESHCLPWCQQHHPDLYHEICAQKAVEAAAAAAAAASSADDKNLVVPTEPWTTEQRLTAFYEKYEPSKVDSVPTLLAKYAGKEDKLFQALTQKYGPEPEDPFYAVAAEGSSTKRRGVSAKKGDEDDFSNVRIVIEKVAIKRKKFSTIIKGMDAVPGIKLKDVAKTLAKKFAGSASVQKGETSIQLQGNFVYQAAELIVDQYGVPEECVFLDLDGEVVPLRES